MGRSVAGIKRGRSVGDEARGGGRGNGCVLGCFPKSQREAFTWVAG